MVVLLAEMWGCCRWMNFTWHLGESKLNAGENKYSTQECKGTTFDSQIHAQSTKRVRFGWERGDERSDWISIIKDIHVMGTWKERWENKNRRAK